MTKGPGRIAGEVAVAGPLPRPPGFRTAEAFRATVETVSQASGPGHGGVRRLAELLAPVLLIALLLGAWELACRVWQVPSYFLAPPSAIGAPWSPMRQGS